MIEPATFGALGHGSKDWSRFARVSALDAVNRSNAAMMFCRRRTNCGGAEPPLKRSLHVARPIIEYDQASPAVRAVYDDETNRLANGYRIPVDGRFVPG